MTEQTQKEVLEKLKVGELKDALLIITTDVAKDVANTLPIFYENLKRTMQFRRVYFSEAMKEVAKELNRLSEEIVG